MSAPRLGAVVLAVALLGTALPGRAAAASVPGVLLRRHQGPPVWGEVVVEDDRVRFEISGEEEALQACFDTDVAFIGPLDEAQRAAAEAEFRDFVAREQPFRVPGVTAEPTLVELEIPTRDELTEGWVFVHARFELPCPDGVRRVDLRWERYDGTEWMGEPMVPITVKRGRKVQLMQALYPEEPAYTWHPDEIRAPAPALPGSAARAEPRRVPALSIGLAAASVAAWVLLRRRPALLRLGVTIGGLVAAGLTTHVALDVGALLRAKPSLPEREAALATFETLHRGIYDAFEAPTDDELYERLAACVDASLLESLYAEIYESLILREEGGAVCAVEAVDVLDRDVAFAEDELAFDVDWSWRVRGIVSHWGHLHRRVNEYRADYRVHHDGESWKIADYEIREQRRLEPENPDETVSGPFEDAGG